MPFETGTADNYLDLLEKIEDFCENELGWTITEAVNTAGGVNAPARLVMRPIGTGSNRPYIYFDNAWDAPNGQYALIPRMSDGYNVALATGLQEGISNVTYTHFSNSTFTYWLYGNDRRLIVIGKIGTIYTSLYVGLFLPFALPSEYLRPWITMGNNAIFDVINMENSRNRFIVEPGLNAAFARLRSGTWIPIHNQANSTNPEPNYVSTADGGMIWPTRTSGQSTGHSATLGGSWGQTMSMANLRPNASGEMPLFQAHIWQRAETLGQYIGALDGIYAAPGFGRSPEQLVSFNGSDFRLFANVHRTGAQHLMAIEEV